MLLGVRMKIDIPLLLDNFKLISLLNVHLKILSHVLAQRLKKILSKLINEDQTGYIKSDIGLKLSNNNGSPFLNSNASTLERCEYVNRFSL
jgi:hypothetical protein